MEKVLNQLGKKDSLKVLLEEYEATLHEADGVNESPTAKCRVNLAPNLKQMELYKPKHSTSPIKDQIDKKIMGMTNKIRYTQNWYNPLVSEDDFGGDEKAMI